MRAPVAGLEARTRKVGITSRLSWGLALLAVLAGCGDAGAERGAGRVMVFAAASLRDVMLEVGQRFEQRSEVELSYNFAGSNVLALQLEAAPGAADVFLSADHLWTDYLREEGLILPDSTIRFLANRLVVVASRTSPLRISEVGDLAAPEIRFVAVGHPEAVPAGRYARTFLESVTVDGPSLWRRVEGRIAPAADVRAALALTAARDDTVGIVYRTDARTAQGVRLLFEIPAEHTPSIGYFAAVTRETAYPEAAADLVRHLVSEEARAIFERHGFDPPAVPSG